MDSKKDSSQKVDTKIEILESQVALLMDRIEGNARRRESYYQILLRKVENVNAQLQRELPSERRVALEAYRNGIIEGMVYLNDDFRSGVMPFDNSTFNKD